MRLSVPYCGQLLAAFGLATSLSFTSLPALSAANAHEHMQLPASAADIGQARQRATNHTRALMALQKQWAQANGAEKSRALEKLVAKAQERQEFLAELIKTNPAEVLRVVIPEEQQQGMPAESLNFVEQRLEVEGELEAVYEDYDDGTHKLRQFLKTPFGERFELHFAGKASRMPSHTRVRAQGLLIEGGQSLDGALALESADSSILTLAADGGETGGPNGGTAAALPKTFGEQKTLVMLVNFQDKPNERPWTTAEINDTVFNEVSDFYLENSSGQSWLTGDVAGWFTLPVPSTSCDNWTISSAADEAAATSGVDLSIYDRYIYVFPRNACGWGGLGTIGGTKSYSWINGTPTLNYVGHELGHNFGLYHSHALDCTDGTLNGSCSSLNYGDTLDIMGNPNAGHFNAFQKEQLGWLSGSSVATIQAIETSGSYDLSSYEFAAAGTPSALKVLKDIDPVSGKKSWYYVEFRQAQGFDSFLSSNSNVENGLVIHSGSDGDRDSSHLLDMTPGSSTWFDMNDPALTVGQSFTDNQAGITLTTQWADSSRAATLEVAIETQSCVTQTPSLVLNSSGSEWVAPGTTVGYSLTLSNNDSLACADSGFDLSATVPSGWTADFTQNSVSLAPGTSTTIELTVTSPLSTGDGFYNIDIAVDNGSATDSVTATYVIDTPVTNSAPVATDDSVTTQADTAVVINVLDNDADPDGDALNITSITQGANGTVTIGGQGTLTYSPNGGFSGTDSFSYTVGDGNGGNASGTVTVTVKAPAINLPPVAVDDAALTLESSAVTLQVLANDSDPENDILSVSGASQGANGRVQVNADGTITYTPDKRFQGLDSFSYNLSDGNHTVQGQVSITVEKSSGKGGGGNTGTSGGGGKGGGKGSK